MSEPNYDAMLWAAADRYMSGGAHPEGEVTFTIERDRNELPEVLRRYLGPDDDCAEFQVECEVDDTDAVVVAVIGYDEKAKKTTRTKTPHIVIPLTRWETQWTAEVAIEQAERRRDAYEADAYDREGDR